jgi:hypothetical protein
MKWTKPKLHELGNGKEPLNAQGQCLNGSGDSDLCNAGTAANDSCTDGAAANGLGGLACAQGVAAI